MRDAEPRGDARGDADGGVEPGPDHPVDRLRLGESMDRRLVVGSDERPPFDELETGGARVAVDCDHADAVQARRLEQTELRAARSEHEQTSLPRWLHHVHSRDGARHRPRHG
jgi:hypothetical protein